MKKPTKRQTAWRWNLILAAASAPIHAAAVLFEAKIPGDLELRAKVVKPVGDGVSELRIDYGAGYRVYFVQRGIALVVLLAGGDKRTQMRDIQRAIALSRTV
jgi:putative addiction module killer protein